MALDAAARSVPNIARMKHSKVVCITGCTRGLGRAMVDEFVALGWNRAA